MSIIIKREIIDLIRNGDLKFEPELDELQFRPHALDLRLGFKFRIPKTIIDKEKGRISLTLDHNSVEDGQFAYFDEITLKPGQYIDILPGQSVMGFSLEQIDLKSPMLMAVVYPRSSVNRRGLAVELTGIVDAGYKGYLMFPIRNTTSQQVIRLYPGERICQIIFERLDQPVPDGYKGRYSNPRSKTAPRYIPEVEKQEIRLIRQGKISELKKKFTPKN
jgi:dCTP deaminase